MVSFVKPYVLRRRAELTVHDSFILRFDGIINSHGQNTFYKINRSAVNAYSEAHVVRIHRLFPGCIIRIPNTKCKNETFYFKK